MRIHNYTDESEVWLVGGPSHDESRVLPDGRMEPFLLREELGHGYWCNHAYIPWVLKGSVVWAYDRLCASEILELLRKRDKEVLAELERRSEKARKEFWGFIPRPDRDQEDESDAETPDEAG